MDKKLLAILAIIGMIICYIVEVITFYLPIILIGVLLIVFVKVCNIIYSQDPEGFASAGSFLLTPALILGWLYFLYIIWIYPTYWPTLVYWRILY